MDHTLHSVIDQVRAAAATGTPLAIRGGGTKDFYGAAATPGEGRTLDTRPLCGIVDYEPSELVVTVRAGTPLAELEAALVKHGQCLPFEPPHFGAPGASTVGGMVAAGLSGPARASVGSVRDYLLGAHLVNGRGELLQFGGTVMKNVAGYDVSRLLAGSLGVLGLISQVSLKVLPVAPAQATLRFACGQAEALALLNGWGGQPLPLNASCWLQEDLNDAASGTLYLRLRGAAAAVDAACARLGGTRTDAMPPDRARVAADWAACRDQRLPWFDARPPGRALWRLSVPQTAPVLPLPPDTFGAPLVEWHGGQRWYQAPAASADGTGTKADPANQLRQAAEAAGGHATIFIAESPCITCAEALSEARFSLLSASVQRIHQALKAEFDPHGVFNRGRLSAAF